MRGYLWFVVKRAIQMVVVIIAGTSVAFLISHLSPVNPVESVLGRITSRSNFSPEAIAEMRSALTDLYGVDKPLPEQYANFMRGLAKGDLGPSLVAFPTPAHDAGHAGAALDPVPPHHRGLDHLDRR